MQIKKKNGSTLFIPRNPDTLLFILIREAQHPPPPTNTTHPPMVPQHTETNPHSGLYDSCKHLDLMYPDFHMIY